jgi:hypothetical protein
MTPISYSFTKTEEENKAIDGHSSGKHIFFFLTGNYKV